MQISASSALRRRTLSPEAPAEQTLDRGERVERALGLGAHDAVDVIEHGDDGAAAAVEGSRMAATSSRPPDTAASAARCETFATLDVSWLWMLVAAGDRVGGTDQPPDTPPRHRIRLGHPVGDQASVGQFGHQHRHGVVLGAAVDEVLVDLVGEDPDALGQRPAADGLDLVAGTPRQSGWTATRRAGPWCWASTPPRGPRRSNGTPWSRRSARRPASRRPTGSTRGRSSSTGRGR